MTVNIQTVKETNMNAETILTVTLGYLQLFAKSN
nr:MAG TPA: hypothetical protein [Caudoviricetes sp.]